MARLGEAFARFSCLGPSETATLSRALLPDALAHFGILPGKAATVQSLATRGGSVAEDDLFNFIVVAQKCAEEETKLLKVAFDKQAPDGTLDADDHSGIAALLGASVQPSSAADAVELAGLSDELSIGFVDFIGIVAVHRVSFGFTAAELEQARRSFDEFAAGPRLRSEEPAAAEKRVPVKKLEVAMLGLFGFYSVPDLQRLTGAFAGTHASSGSDWGLSFAEFVAFAWRVRQAELLAFQDAFAQADTDNDGFLSVEDLVPFMSCLNIRPFAVAVRELVKQCGVAKAAADDARLDFEAAIRFARACRHNEGFSSEETAELRQVFRRFDFDSSGELHLLKVVDILTFMGYNESVEDMRQIVEEVDVNGNGTMDLGEFFHMFRRHRQEELSTAHVVFEDASSLGGELPVAEIATALESMGFPTQSADSWMHLLLCVLNGHKNRGRAVSEGASRDGDNVDFEGFVRCADHCRKQFAERKHKRADFSDQEFAIICTFFAKHCKPDTDALGKGEFLWLLVDFGLPVHLADGRRQMLEMLERARNSARSVGLSEKEVGPPGSPDVTFDTIVHFLRLVAAKAEEAMEVREREGIAETAFAVFEVASFREVFSEWLAREQVSPEAVAGDSLSKTVPARGSRPHPVSPAAAGSSLVEGRGGAIDAGRRTSIRRGTQAIQAAVFTAQPPPPPVVAAPVVTPESVVGHDRSKTHLPFLGVKGMLAHIGVRLSWAHSAELRSAIAAITGAASDDKKLDVDFADFLRIMRWVLDQDFADVRSAADRLVAAKAPAEDSIPENAPVERSPARRLTRKITRTSLLSRKTVT